MLRRKLEVGYLGNAKGLVPLYQRMVRAGLVSRVSTDHTGTLVDVDPAATEARLITRGNRHNAPKIPVKRAWDDAIDRSVRQKLEREGYGVSSPNQLLDFFLEVGA